MKISTLFSITDITLPEESLSEISKRTGEWVIISKRNGRQLVDAVVEPGKFAEIEALLADLAPTVYGVWDNNGQPTMQDTYPQNSTDYLDMLPDLIQTDEEGNITSTTRPETPNFIHSFAGWGGRVWAATS